MDQKTKKSVSVRTILTFIFVLCVLVQKQNAICEILSVRKESNAATVREF